MMMMQRLMCHQTQQQQQQQQQTQPPVQQQQNPSGSNSTSGSIRSSTPPRILTFSHHPFHRVHGSESSPTIDTRVRNIDTVRGDSDKFVVDVSAVPTMHQASGMRCTDAASPQRDDGDAEALPRDDRTSSKHFRGGTDEGDADGQAMVEKADAGQGMDIEEDDEDVEMNEGSEDEEEELNVEDEDQEASDLMLSPVDLTNRHDSGAHLVLANHRLLQAPSDILEAHSPATCNTNSLSSSPKGDAPGDIADKTSRSTYRSESVSSVGSGLSVGGHSGGGPSTTTAGSARRNLAFSVENILDPTKFTGRGHVQHAARRLVAAPRLTSEPGGHATATPCCWRPHLDTASPDRTDDSSGGCYRPILTARHAVRCSQLMTETHGRR